MLSLIRSRSFALLIGFLLIALFVWFAGPLFAFARYSPLETEFARLVAIAVLLGCWIGWTLLKRWRARLANGQLVGAVLGQSRPEKDRPSAETTKLRERFEEAVAMLKQQRRGSTLYDLPWYVFIGAPGSGKTTALVNSGLKFPLEQRVGKAAVRGVGGTRNCDWWFTDEAVFLDTAGRYTTQDSDASSDSEGWSEFLKLLDKYRKRRPVNGIVLTISAQDLMTQGDAGRDAHVEAARRRLNELTRELRIQLPVYVMVTKCDMVAGFTEYFDDLTQDGRAQVWGVTFPYEQTLNGEAAEAFPAEFDLLMARLNARLFPRLSEERGTRRRATVFAFPQQMAGLRDLLAQFVGDVFSSTRLDRQLLLRGVYLTSGTQDGTRIDRLLGAIGRRFGVAPDSVAPAPGRGKSFFVERLLKDVVIGESGLAGVDRRLELQKAAWQLGAYAAIVMVLVVGVVAFSVSAARNREYLGEVATEVGRLQRVPPAAAAASVEAWWPHLNAVRAVQVSANRYRDDTPWGMRWGLYQGTAVGNSARDAYVRELDSVLLPRFAARVRQHLVQSESDPDRLFVYLKAYLMLGDPRRLDKTYLQLLADQEWKPSETVAAGPSLATHFHSLLEYSDTLRPLAVDSVLVEKARSTIRQASIPKIMYGQLQRSYSGDSKDGLRLDISAVGIENVFGRKSGRRFSEPMPGLYTQKVFKQVAGAGLIPLVKQFAEDDWVWGASGTSVASVKLLPQVLDLYERDYSATWDGLLADLEIKPFATVPQYADLLGMLAGPTSPLKALLKTVVEQTSLVTSPAETAAPSITSRITEGAKDLFNDVGNRITGTTGLAPGTAVTQHFQPIHRLMSGAPAPIDGVLEQIRKIRELLLKLGPQAGGGSPLRALTDPALLDARRMLQEGAVNLPAPINALVVQMASDVGGSVGPDATRELERMYQEQVVAGCRARVEGHYPFANGGDMSLTDFGDVFGRGGLYEKFFADNLDKLVDRLQRRWAWRPESVQPSSGMLAQFEAADRIRQMFFSAESKMPEIPFTITLSNLDAAAMRLYVNIDGQAFDVTPGAQRRVPAVWPVLQKGGVAFATFTDGVAAPVQAIGFEGPWALFRLIDATRVPAAQRLPDGDLRSLLRFQTKDHSAQVTIEATNATANPFAANDWRQFRCEP